MTLQMTRWMVSLGLAAACGGGDPSLSVDELSSDACPSTCRAGEAAADAPHGGVVPGEGCQFKLVDTDMWDTSVELIDAMRTCDGTGVTSDVVAPVLRVGSFVDAGEGILEGTEIKVIRLAPLGDPIEIGLRGYHLSSRKSEAEQIEITPFR